jgi:serine/threonine protein kinase
MAFICKEILYALEYMHAKNWVHRDIKSTNIMITTKGEVKVSMCLFIKFKYLRKKMEIQFIFQWIFNSSFL